MTIVAMGNLMLSDFSNYICCIVLLISRLTCIHIYHSAERSELINCDDILLAVNHVDTRYKTIGEVVSRTVAVYMQQ